MTSAHVQSALDLLTEVEAADLATKIELFEQVHSHLKQAVAQAEV
jgi:hypothetical protein